MFLKGQFTPNASLSLLCQRFCYTLANCWWKSAVMPGYIQWELFSCSYRTHTHWDSSQPKTINEMWEQQRLIMCLFIITFLILLCWSFTALPYPSLVVNSPKKVVTVTYTHRKWPCSERGDCHFFKLLLLTTLYTTQYIFTTDVLYRTLNHMIGHKPIFTTENNFLFPLERFVSKKGLVVHTCSTSEDINHTHTLWPQLFM